MIGGTASLMTAGFALLGVLLMIGIAARLARAGGWMPRHQAGKRLTLRESLALDPRRRLHLVQCGDRQVLLLTGGSTDVVVAWMDTP